MLHQRMDFAAAWVRWERSSSADCRKQILLPAAIPRIGWTGLNRLGRMHRLHGVESSIAEAHSVLRPGREVHLQSLLDFLGFPPRIPPMLIDFV
jgi:hypothetical protein